MLQQHSACDCDKIPIFVDWEMLIVDKIRSHSCGALRVSELSIIGPPIDAQGITIASWRFEDLQWPGGFLRDYHAQTLQKSLREAAPQNADLLPVLRYLGLQMVQRLLEPGTRDLTFRVFSGRFVSFVVTNNCFID